MPILNRLLKKPNRTVMRLPADLRVDVLIGHKDRKSLALTLGQLVQLTELT